MNNIRAIKTEEQYLSYLSQIEQLIGSGNELKRDDLDRLEVISILVEAYESKAFPIEPLDPIEAIIFRMQEKGLKQADLIPYFGTSSRVSEVLARKRPLTVQMIRALSVGLGISSDTLIGLDQDGERPNRGIDWAKFPLKEMVQRGWISIVDKSALEDPEKLVERFISGSGLQLGTTSFRRTLLGDANSPTATYALFAWVARVVQKARDQRRDLGHFDPELLSSSFLKELAKLSWFETGPLLAIELLRRNGIAVVIEPQLKGTLLDGAALKDVDGLPIIALTLRFDRLDSFWFTLLHEVVHIWKHISNDQDTFVDDLSRVSDERKEAEANRIASESFIPRLIWRRSDAYLSPNRENIENLANELKVHPAVIAGRLRHERGNYSMFSELVGQNELRPLFLDTR
jgi:HTH-type transcriptional regulator/antitoxin HigA